jgi:hypothetical protein
MSCSGPLTIYDILSVFAVRRKNGLYLIILNEFVVYLFDVEFTLCVCVCVGGGGVCEVYEVNAHHIECICLSVLMFTSEVIK